MSAAVVLAAGAGRRLGGVAKAALRLADGRTFLEAVRDIGAAAGVTDWVVVAGPPYESETRAVADALGLPVICNPKPERGMSSSVAVGFASLLDRACECESALLWPVDHPRVQASTVRSILDQGRADGAVIARYGRRGGHPCAFGRDIWVALSECAEAPIGARSVIAALDPAQVRRPSIDDPGLIADVDTPAALAEIRASGAEHTAVER